MNRNTLGIFKTILWIGLVAGTLDIAENLVFSQLRGVTPWRVFQYIASGLMAGKLSKVVGRQFCLA